mmetsp:Transcript_22116/g.36232  ORF Transcript_22116/g.36232 Transcript_22116/m.36232 type:complete len:260 (-) Transcript_22116:278-1057(-)
MQEAERSMVVTSINSEFMSTILRQGAKGGRRRERLRTKHDNGSLVKYLIIDIKVYFDNILNYKIREEYGMRCWVPLDPFPSIQLLGPKIDIQLEDALKRRHQCATVQLDFQLPKRFGLKFKRSNECIEEPVIVHRAILGSVERMMAVLIEQWGGKWPLWLSPRQVCIVPIAPELIEYAEKVGKILHDRGFYVDVDSSKLQFKKKIALAATSKTNYVLVVGGKEAAASSVNVRTRENKIIGAMTIEDFIGRMQDEIKEFK